MREVNRNPKRYPPVTPRSEDRPPEKLANTGSPKAPIKRYNATAMEPYFQPRRPTVMKTAIVWSVTGMGPMGTVIHEHTAMSAVARAMYTMIFVLEYSFIGLV